nr:MAG: replication initiator protein [Microviridae sp.]
MKCPQPYIVQHHGHYYSEYPCGRCLACRQLRARDWAQRIKYEMEDKTTTGDFCTFTIDDAKTKPEERLYLDKTELQKLIKRIRKNHKIKYYACGEYGEKHGRKHYHALILRKSNQEINYEKYWQMGRVEVGSVSEASIAYVTGYILKANAVPPGLPDNAKPFHVWSRGIGDKYMSGKSYLEMAREGNIPRRWRALAAENEIPYEAWKRSTDTIQEWQSYGRQKEQNAFTDRLK